MSGDLRGERPLPDYPATLSLAPTSIRASLHHSLSLPTFLFHFPARRTSVSRPIITVLAGSAAGRAASDRLITARVCARSRR